MSSVTMEYTQAWLKDMVHYNHIVGAAHGIYGIAVNTSLCQMNTAWNADFTNGI